MQEMIDIIDAQDTVLRTATREEARQKNLMHRSAHIYIFNSKGHIFIHKRTQTKDIFPGLYDMKVGGVVSSGESYLKAAKRELKEEIGAEAELEFLFNFRYKTKDDNFLAKVYKCIYDGPIQLQEEEIEEGLFVSFEKLKEMMTEIKFCPDSIEEFKHFESIM